MAWVCVSGGEAEQAAGGGFVVEWVSDGPVPEAVSLVLEGSLPGSRLTARGEWASGE